MREAKFLGQKVSSDGVSLSVGHIVNIKHLIEPGSGNELMKYFGIGELLIAFGGTLCNVEQASLSSVTRNWLLEETEAW